MAKENKWKKRAQALREGVTQTGPARPAMSPIAEEVVEQTAERASQMEPEDVQAFMDRWAEEQPLMLAFLMARGDQMLNEAEQGQLLYLGTVVYQALLQGDQPLRQVTERELGRAEDRNLEMLTGAIGRPDADLEVVARTLLKDAAQPDMVRYLIMELFEGDEEEGSEVRDEMKGMIFFTLKTVVDCWGT